MGCITKKLRGYGFLAQMMQLPIVMLQRTKYFRGRKVFNNICFWISMILGLSIVSTAPCRVRSNRRGELTFRRLDVCAICAGLGVLVPHQLLGALLSFMVLACHIYPVQSGTELILSLVVHMAALWEQARK